MRYSFLLAVLLSSCATLSGVEKPPDEPPPALSSGVTRVMKFATPGPEEGGIYVCSPRGDTVYCLEYVDFQKRMAKYVE